MNRDPQFGPLVMFGLGGIYVEVLKDVSFAVAPLTDSDVREMIGGIRSAPLLKGARQPTWTPWPTACCGSRSSQWSSPHWPNATSTL